MTNKQEILTKFKTNEKKCKFMKIQLKLHEFFFSFFFLHVKIFEFYSIYVNINNIFKIFNSSIISCNFVVSYLF